MPTPEEQYIAQIEPRIKRTLIVCTILLGLTVLVILFGSVSTFRPSADDPEVWFQRSGALLVAFGAIVEFMLLSINGAVNPSGSSGEQHLEMARKYQLKYRIMSYVAFVVIFVGTVIWGYGDLLYKLA